MSEKNVCKMLVKLDFLWLSLPSKARAVTTIFDPLLKPTKTLINVGLSVGFLSVLCNVEQGERERERSPHTDRYNGLMLLHPSKSHHHNAT